MSLTLIMVPVERSSWRTRFTLVAAHRATIGSPILRAIMPAVTCPAAPDGMLNATVAACAPSTWGWFRTTVTSFVFFKLFQIHNGYDSLDLLVCIAFWRKRTKWG